MSGKVSSQLCDHRGSSPGYRSHLNTSHTHLSHKYKHINPNIMMMMSCRYDVRRPRTLSVGSGGCEGHWRGGGLYHQHMLCLDGASDSHWLIQNTHTDSDNCSLYTTPSQDDSECRTGVCFNVSGVMVWSGQVKCVCYGLCVCVQVGMCWA